MSEPEMQVWFIEPVIRGKARVIKMVALFMIAFIIGCSAPPTGERDQIPISTEQIADRTFTPPVSIPTVTKTPEGKPQSSPPENTPTPAIIPAITPSISPTSAASPEQEPQPFIPVLGGADKLTFIEQDEIWIANLDGSPIIRMTKDGNEKSSLQWSPDGKTLFYISGQCIKFNEYGTMLSEDLACFEEGQELHSFQISPDGTQAAISVGYELYVVPFDHSQLSQTRTASDLGRLGTCASLSPYRHRQSMVRVTRAYWSDDGKRLAILRQGYEYGEEVELIHLLDISSCTSPLPRLDEFPATRIEMENYQRTPVLQDFAWDGGDLFALTDFNRNDGFGDLWIYNTDLHQGYKANPIEGKCCYRDPVFSPDGKYLAFVFQDTSLEADKQAIIYFIPYAALDSSLVFPPLPLPEDFFEEPRSKPQPALRPVP